MPRPKLDRNIAQWQRDAIATYAATGNLTKAAQAAGLKRRELVKAMDRDDWFRSEMKDSHEAYLDGVEEALAGIVKGQKGNPLPGFAILKSHRASLWTDKGQGVAVQVNIGTEKAPITDKQLEDLFRKSLADATPETRKVLAGVKEGDDVVNAVVVEQGHVCPTDDAGVVQSTASEVVR